MPTLTDATKKPSNVGDPIPPATPYSQAPPAIIPREQPGLSTGSLGPAPSVWTTDYDRVRQWYRPGTSQQRFPPLPSKANPAINASAQSISTRTTAAAIAAIPPAPVIKGVTDGLIHGSTPWEIDPSSVIWNEDFITSRTPGNNANTSPYMGSSSAWAGFGATGALGNFQNFNLFPSHAGVNQWYNTGAANAVAIFLPVDGGNSEFGSEGASLHLLPLLDYPGWKATWVFMFSKAWACGQTPTGAAFSVTKTMTYVGFSSGYGTSGGSLSAFNGFRPNIFIGLRYDTDPGQTGLSVTAVSAPTSGIATYTGTFPLGASGYYIGNSITITGCAATNNNGTFICTDSTTTTLSLINASATVASGQTAAASCPGINDTTFQFEWVANPFNSTGPGNLSRNNTQGTVVNTSITPTENVWYRLDLQSTVAGQVVLTLSGGGQQFSNTMTCSKVTLGDTTNSSSFNWFQTNGWVKPNGGSFTYNGTNTMASPWGVGSILTVTNPPTGMTTGPFVTYGNGGSTNSIVFPFTPTITTGSKNSTFTGYPALWPTFWSGNDSTSGFPTTGRAWNLDFFGLAYNPGLSGAAVNTTYSRYFSGT